MRLTNNQSIQKIMDTLAFFSDRIESFRVNEEKETIISIINVHAQVKVSNIPRIRFGPDPHQSGELQILMDLVTVTFGDRHKDTLYFNAICHISAWDAKQKPGLANVDLVLLLDHVSKTPVLNKACHKLKKQLKEFAESIGLPPPSWSE
jgi:hypothetical protein